MNNEDTLTMKEAAKYLGHCYSWLYANHRILGLRGYQIGSSWRFDKADLDAYVASAKERYGSSPRSDMSRGASSKKVSLV